LQPAAEKTIDRRRFTGRPEAPGMLVIPRTTAALRQPSRSAPDLQDVLAELQESARWAQSHHDEAAGLWVQELKLSPAVAARIANYEVSEPVPIGEKELVSLESLNEWLVGSKLLPRPAAIKDHIVPVSRPSVPR